MRRLVWAVAFVALLGVGIGCTNDDNPPGSSSNFYGMYTDQSSMPGTIALTGVAPATSPLLLGGGASTPLIGTLDLAGQGPIDLSGVYFTETGVLSFTNDEDGYTFTGQVTGGSAVGTSTGPNGPGAFALVTGGTAETVAVFCGSASCTAPPGCKAAASFYLAVGGSTAALTVFIAGESVPAIGTRTGDNVSFHITDKGSDVTILGVLNGTSVGGTWSDNVNGTSGTWNGNTAACSITPARR